MSKVYPLRQTLNKSGFRAHRRATICQKGTIMTSGESFVVAYFSCKGATRRIAEYIAAKLGADLYPILPEEPYTEADLDWTNSRSRATAEMNTRDARPILADLEPDLSRYDRILLGHPIWWGSAPKIMETFIEACDFTGKTVTTFCTSGSSDIASSANRLRSLSLRPGRWLESRRFSRTASEKEISAWLAGLDW